MSKKAKIGFYLDEIESKHKLNNEELFGALDSADELERYELECSIVTNNLALVHYVIRKRYPNVQSICQNIRVTYDDLFSIGYYALMKAMHTFDLSKGYKFATYASMVMHNEFGMFMRKHKRSFSQSSMETSVAQDAKGNDLTLMDILVDNFDGIEEVTVNQFGFIVMEEMERQLKPRELSILRMYISGEDGEGMSQKDIAKTLGISQSYISRILTKTLVRAKEIYKELEG